MTHDSEFILQYRGENVGMISNAFQSDETWNGYFSPSAALHLTAAQTSAMEYVAFCKNWNERIRDSVEHTADSSEFDAFASVISTGKWTVTSPHGGEALAIEEAPVFFPNSEVSFRLL